VTLTVTDGNPVLNSVLFVVATLLLATDAETLAEMGTFIINAKGKAEAQHGCRDDRVIALGLCLQGHIRCPQHEPPRPKDTEDQPINSLAWMSA